MTQDDKLIGKIRAILRKADESVNPSEAEREEAMRAANRLLLKHGLTMQDVGDIEGDTTPAGRAFEHDEMFQTHGDQDSWQGTLLFRIANVYWCKVYRSKRRAKKGAFAWMILGRGDHVATTRTMFDWIAPQLEGEFLALTKKMTQHRRYARRYAIRAARLGHIEFEDDFDLATIGAVYLRQRMEEVGLEGALLEIEDMLNCNRLNAERTKAKILKEDIAPQAPDNLGVWRRSFFEGAIARVSKRLREMMKAEVTDLGSTGMELVRNEKAALEKFEKDLDLGLRTNRSSRDMDAAGLNAGREAGDRLDLSPHARVSGVNARQLNS